MEVGAVKQAFNNELILLKKKLNQARIQIIHKLTRKAKTFVEKKAPEKLKDKLKRKAEAAVNEVLIIKKIKPKDLARFIVTHKGDLNSHLNKPNVDEDKACARLLLHKSLQDKYKLMRERFSSVPIEDLLMSREERKKQKKEAREKQKNKKKGDSKVVNAEGDWNVEDVEMPTVKPTSQDDAISNEDEDMSADENNVQDTESDDESNETGQKIEINGAESDISEDHNDVSGDESGSESNNGVEVDTYDNSDDEEKTPNDVGKFVKATSEKTVNKPHILNPKPFELKITAKDIKKPDKKPKDKNKQEKNKNLNEKLLSRKFKKDVEDTPMQEAKVVDPFFITSTGESYMSVAEPRQPDEIKEEHKQGNRKLRRAVMFGHVPKIKPRRDDRPDNSFNRNNNNGFNKNDGFKKFNNSDNSDKRNFTDKRSNFNRNRQEEFNKPEKEEKLHPSWEAKKKQSGILPFQGKKIVFDES